MRTTARWRRLLGVALWPLALAGCAANSAAYLAGTAAPTRSSLASWFNTRAPAELEVQPPLLVRPLVNGVDVGWFFVDTGATGMVISPQAAAASGLTPAGSVSVIGARRFEAPSFRAGRFELGPLHLRNVDFAAADVGFISPGPATPVVGIVGADVFLAATVEIDMATGGIRLFEPGQYLLPQGRWTPLTEVPGGIAVPVRFEGDRDGLFIVDTGGDFGIAFDLANPESAAILAGRPTRRQWLRGVGGIEAGHAGELAWIEIGGTRLGPAGARFFSAGRLNGAGPEVTGLVGSQVLREFLLVMDWGNRRAAFLPRQGPRASNAGHTDPYIPG